MANPSPTTFEDFINGVQHTNLLGTLLQQLLCTQTLILILTLPFKLENTNCIYEVLQNEI